ncbi:MAG: DUF3352 domain-containing protein [Candidatus Aminicenantales bacterium]
MKKFAVFGIIFVFVFLPYVSCKKEAEAPKAGSASVDDMLALVPEDAMGLFFIDFHKAMSMEIINKAIQEDKNYQKYQEFIQVTGIDPQEDIYFVTVAVTESAEKPKGGAVINMKYDKGALLNVIKTKAAEEGQEIKEQDYSGVPLYSVWEEKGEESYFSFLDDSNIIVGNDVVVKSIIDVLQKKKQNILKNKALSDLISKTNRNAMIWGAMLIPEKAMSQVASQNPMLSNLQAINAASMFFDYKDKNLITEIKVMSSDEAKVKEVADLLNGVKAMGSMASAQKPEIGELIKSIEITSAPDHVKIYAKIPEELIRKLKEEKKS